MVFLGRQAKTKDAVSCGLAGPFQARRDRGKRQALRGRTGRGLGDDGRGREWKRNRGRPISPLVNNDHGNREARRWSREYGARLVRDEVTTLKRIQNLGQLELMMLSLPERVRSPLSVDALREDLQVSHKTANAWLDALERLYAIFRLPAFGAAPRLRAIKKGRKHYHFDWTVVPEHGPRFENLTACHLLKWVHHQQDTEGLDIELRCFRDRDGAGKSTSSSSSRVFHRFSSNANGPIPARTEASNT